MIVSRLGSQGQEDMEQGTAAFHKKPMETFDSLNYVCIILLKMQPKLKTLITMAFEIWKAGWI